MPPVSGSLRALSKPFASINTGLDLRYQKTKAYDDYFTEPANVWDLTKDHKYIDVYNSIYFPNPFTSFAVPGWPGRYATDGVTNGDTNHSRGSPYDWVMADPDLAALQTPTVIGGAAFPDGLVFEDVCTYLPSAGRMLSAP